MGWWYLDEPDQDLTLISNPSPNSFGGSRSARGRPEVGRGSPTIHTYDTWVMNFIRAHLLKLTRTSVHTCAIIAGVR